MNDGNAWLKWFMRQAYQLAAFAEMKIAWGWISFWEQISPT
jgi:hypothetical protein